MTITVNRTLLITIVVTLVLVGIFYFASKANLIFRRFSATVLTGLNGGVVTVPQKISNLVAVAGNGRASLAWAAPSDGGGRITAYRVYRGESLNNLNFLTAVQTESFTDSGLQNGVTYYYKVAGVNIMGEGPMSEAVNVLPRIGGSDSTSAATKQSNGNANVGNFSASSVPGAVYDLAAVAGSNMASLAWAEPYANGRPITSYKIYRGTYSGGETYFNSATATAFTDTNLLNNTAYYYRVSAVNSLGEGALSSRVAVIPRPFIGVPGQISNLVATPGNSQVALFWSEPQNNGYQSGGYKIYRGTSLADMSYYTTVNSTSFMNVGLINGRGYYFKVSAINAIGEGPISAEVYAVPMSYYGSTTNAPGSIINFSANPGDARVFLSWSAPQSDVALISYYKIYRNSSYYGGESFYTTCNANSFTDTSVINGVTYSYRVSAVNSFGEGDLSYATTATPYVAYYGGGNPYYPPYYNPVTIPGQVTNLSAGSNNGKAVLNWSAPYNGGSPIQQYRIYRGISSGSDSLLSSSAFVNYTDSSVSVGHTYYYRVKAVNDLGESGWSNQVSVTISSSSNPATVPGQITGLNVSNASGRAVLTWAVPYNGGSPIQQYRIYRGTSAGSDSLLANTSSATYTDSSVSTGHTYYYRVKAVNTIGESGWSNQASVTIPAQSSSHSHDDDDDDYTPSYTSEYVRITDPDPNKSVEVVQGNNFSVSWQASSNFKGCRVWFEGGDPNSVIAGLSGSDSASFSTIGVAAGTYEVAVRCFREHEMGLMFDYKEDDYRDKPDSGLRKASNITVVKGASYSCSCTNGTASGGIAKCSDIARGGTFWQYQCSKQGKGNWTNGFSCN